MIGGLPAGTWLLLFACTVPGLALVVAAYKVHSKGDLKRRGRETGTGGAENRIRAPGRGNGGAAAGAKESDNA